MAENNSSSVPPQMNLEEILRTLSSLQPIPATQQEEQGPSGVESQTSYNDFLSQSHASTTTQSYPEVYHGDPRLNGRVQPQHRVSTPAKPPPPKASTPVADSSSIIEWKHGLRAVSKNASQNPTFEGTVQKMILDQKRNVRDWEAGRRRLLEEHKSKREIEQSQRAAISIPGLLDNAPLLRVSRAYTSRGRELIQSTDTRTRAGGARAVSPESLSSQQAYVAVSFC